MRNFFAGAASALLAAFFAFTAFAAFGEKSVTVYTDSAKVIFNQDDTPIISNNKIYLPLRKLSETLGKEVYWHDASKSAFLGERKTLKDFLKTAMTPVGETMYIWNGGWNDEETGAGPEGMTIGPSPNWKAFYEKQTASYDYNKTRYMSADGLDCTGFIGWAVFNLLPNDTGYVVKSDYMVQTYASYGWGTLIKKNDIQTRVPGDIMGKSGHAWISLGTCADGSVLILHSSPPGAQLCGTQSGSVKSDAVKLAENFTAAYYPEWNAKFPDRVRNNAYLTDYDMFRWDPEFLPDPDGIRESSPEKVLEILFEK